MRILFGLGLVPLALLAGCGQSEQAMMQQLRTSMLDQCRTQTSGAAAQGIDASRFCTCLVDKALAGRTVADFEKMGKDGTAEAAGLKAGNECRNEQMGAAAAAPGAATAPAPVTQQEAEKAGAETVEEGADEAE